jgi:RimJ/RimL family protein N-acetyltransferase
MNTPLPLDVFPRTIETARLALQRPDDDRVALYASQAQQACLQPKALSTEEALRFGEFMLGHWQRFGFGFLVASTIDDSGVMAPIGHIGFKYTDARPGHWPEHFDAIELGYSLIPSARGRGYATEGAMAALTAAFEAFDVSRILAKCSRENSKSAAVLLRCGMREVESPDDMRRFVIERAD